MDEVVEQIGQLGLVPVIKIERAADAVRLGRALVEGDLPVAEVTFRTDAAEAAIGKLASELPELLVGAGTVLTTDQADRAVKAGARFIVSPGFNPRVVDWCLERGVPVTPGMNSPSQLEMALERGLEVVKFFPAEATGGLAMLKAMAGPYGGVRFIPTGGINQSNIASYLAYDRVLACGGSWMVKADLISAGKFDEITRLVRAAVAAVHGFEIVRLGIATKSEGEALEEGRRLSGLFFWRREEEKGRSLLEGGLELFSGADAGGRIVIAANSLPRALAYLKAKGITPIAGEEAAAQGEVELDLHIAGLPVGLTQR